MRSLSIKVLWLTVLMISGVSLAMGATITGTVKGPGGAPFEGAFVEARNTSTNISTDVLSHANGSYMVPNLPAGNYQLTIRAVGYKAAPQSETLQSADQHAKADFALEKGTVSWSDISAYQGRQLLPNGPGKVLLFGPKGQPFGAPGPMMTSQSGGPCLTCHDFQSRMASRRLNYQDWLGMVNYMRFDVVPEFLSPKRFTNQMADEAATYLSTVFGLDSTLPASPADLPGYEATVLKFSNQAMNIVYVVYPTPDSTWLDFQMYPPTAKGYPSDGSIWTADFGNANKVDQINPKNGEAKEYHTVTCPGPANIHAIEVGPDGYAWFAESSCNRVGRVDPRTGKVTEFEYKPANGRGNPHDSHPMLVGGKLEVFSSGAPTRLDPATGKFTPIPGVPNAYDVYEDKTNGNLWFTMVGKDGALVEVDPQTLKTVMRFAPTASQDPKNFRSHRIAVDPNGVVWTTCSLNRVCRFDPKTKAFKLYVPLGPKDDAYATDTYAIALDNAGDVWYSMSDLDTIQRLNPRTGHMVEYPFPYPEITMRRFWTDPAGRIWTTSPANGNVVYWYLESDHMRAGK
ncbi:MAG TPA: carboxypeptidase regulatory-like domain-containing protein [Patescibacteria group bacterium]|nr:carboxypeptidase regulatory-like domain-containing protein [Patescibacteria group bacterium]